MDQQSPPMSEYPLKITATSSEPQKQSKRRFQGVRRWYLGGLLLLASTAQSFWRSLRVVP